MYILFFCFIVDIHVGFASASSNLASPSYNSPWSTRECTDLLCTFHAFCHYTPVLPNILLAEEVGQCPLACSRQYIVVHRAGIRPLVRQNILPLTRSDDSEQFHCVIRKCHQSAHHDGTCCKGLNPALSTTISHLEEASGHWLTSSANRMLCHVCSVDSRKKGAIQYLSVILHKNSLLLVLECLFSTPCLHLRSLHVASGATDLDCEMFVS
jgi:hypothetical protein